MCRYSESIDDLRMLYEKKERKISKKRKTYKAFREKLHVSIISPYINNVGNSKHIPLF